MQGAEQITLADLAPVRRWVAWRTEPQRGTGRITKVPKNPWTLSDAASTRPEDWGTRDAAEDADQRMPPSKHGPGGVGVVLGEWPDGHRIGGVDLDSCRDPATGSIATWAREVLMLLGTYAEVSPSGTGIKALFTMEAGAIADLRGARLLEADGFGRSFKRGTGADHPPAIEAHLGGRYYAVTGDRLADMPDALRTVPTATLARLLRDIGPAFKRADHGENRPDRSAKAFRLAGRIRREGGDFNDLCAALDRDPDTAAWKQEKGTDRELRRAWERAKAGDTAPPAWGLPDMALAERDVLPPPAWPHALFPGDWGAFIDLAAEARGCPPDYVGLGLLASTAARIGNSRWGSPWGAWREPTALWACAIGQPSSGKSGGLDVAADALGEIEAAANDDWDARQREYRTRKQEAEERRAIWKGDVKEAAKRGVAAPMEPDGAREPAEPARRRCLTTDPTTEKAGRLAAENPRGLLLLRDELAGWIGGMDRYGGGAGADRAFWIEAYGGRRWTPDRVKDGASGIDVRHLTWSVLGAIQPDRVASLLMSGDDDGLTARFIYAWPAPLRPRRPERAPPRGRLAAALRRIGEMEWQEPEPVILAFTPEAADMMQEWRGQVADMEGEASGLFLSWIGKLPGFALRLAVVFEHLDWLASPGAAPPAEIGADAMARACGFLSDYAAPMARRVFGEAALPQSERDARRLARWYLRLPTPRPELLNAKALRRMAGGPGIATAERIDAALADLAAGEWCRPAPSRAGDAPGRTRKDWAMNPALREAAP